MSYSGPVRSAACIALALGCLVARPAPAQDPAGAVRAPAVATGGMVSTAHPLATGVGVAILSAGGTAFDAAVAIAVALNVVEPMMSGIGGYGTVVVYHAGEGRARFLNPSGRIPAGVDSDAYRPPTPGYEANRRGAKAVSTPGNVKAWEAMWRAYGTLEWPALFRAAIGLAEDGFAVSAHTAGLIARAYDAFPAHARAYYGRGGRPLREGERLVQRDLGRSLRLIAAGGAAAVHGGELGRAIDAAMREAGGFLTLEDLVQNQAEWWEPIAIEYRGHRVLTASPPANAFPALVRLGMMSRFDARALGHNTTGYLHRFAEVTKHAFWTRLRWAGDPDIAPPPLDRLLSERYWAEWAGRIDADRASRFEPPGATSDSRWEAPAGSELGWSRHFRPPMLVGEAGPEARHTTHFVVADRWGNVVSATQTLGNLFGSRIMPEGTGIWLNNSLAYSTFEPAGNPMDAHAGRRKLSGDVPALVFRDGRPWVAIGTPGGHTIGQTVPQMIMNLIDFGMDIQRAIAAPRVSFVEPNRLAVEAAVPAAVRDELAAMGHEVHVVKSLGNAHGLTIEYRADGTPVRFTGGADPRGEGEARGVDAAREPG